MAQPEPQWNDERVEKIMGNLLRIGVLIAATVVVAGGLLYLYRYGGQRPHYRLFRGEPQDLRNVSGAVRDVLGWHSRGLIQVGLLLLIATPVARVLFATYAFARERDWLYVGVTIIVLIALVYSLVWSKV